MSLVCGDSGGRVYHRHHRHIILACVYTSCAAAMIFKHFLYYITRQSTLYWLYCSMCRVGRTANVVRPEYRNIIFKEGSGIADISINISLSLYHVAYRRTKKWSVQVVLPTYVYISYFIRTFLGNLRHFGISSRLKTKIQFKSWY